MRLNYEPHLDSFIIHNQYDHQIQNTSKDAYMRLYVLPCVSIRNPPSFNNNHRFFTNKGAHAAHGLEQLELFQGED